MAEFSLKEKVHKKVQEIVSYLVINQGKDGAWYYCFESGTLTDAFMIILLRHLNIHDEIYIKQLAQRVAARQDPSGTWKLFYDEPEGNLSATIESYYALLLAGYRKKDEPEMIKAREFILARGGLREAGWLTKIILAITGHYPWKDLPELPAEIVLLPTWAPVNFYDLVGDIRVHVAPVLICSSKKYVLKIPDGPDLSDLYPPASRQVSPPGVPLELIREINKTLKQLPFPLNKIRHLAIKKLERFMLARTEWDGALYSYLTSTSLMIFALLALGYEKNHPVISKAVRGLKAMACYTATGCHQQGTTSTVWDTAIIASALQAAGLPHEHPAIKQAAAYLLAKQHTKYGDWQIHNPQGRPGGWGFSHSNTMNPDLDDTSYALRALHRQAMNQPGIYGPAWQAGLDWLLTMQNDDGGWPAFAKNTDKKWPNLLPVEPKPLTDPSMPDLTGRTLEFLGNYAGISLRNNQVKKAVQWLLENQQPDGSWYGRWGVTYICGAWSAVTGLTAAGLDPRHRAVQKAVNWLLSVQNPDGGWGESCLSDIEQRYIPLGFSTPTQTAWALEALIAAGQQEKPAVARGVEALLRLMDLNGLETVYPTGGGFPGWFYVHYHSHRYVWPLLTFSRYLQK